MWTTNSRETNWSQLDRQWDVLIVGGGITGAGILRETSRLGLQSLLIDLWIGFLLSPLGSYYSK